MGDLFGVDRSAVLDTLEFYRYRLDRFVQPKGIVFAYFGVNGSTAGPIEDDQTTKKWFGFTLRNGGSRYIAGNAFGFRARDVRRLSEVDDPIGPENARYLAEIIAEADVLVPCWGARAKVPQRLWPTIDGLRDQIMASGKPVRIFGLTASGDPKHPQMLGYDTPLVEWPYTTETHS
jgi:hypothetical protein